MRELWQRISGDITSFTSAETLIDMIGAEKYTEALHNESITFSKGAYKGDWKFVECGTMPRFWAIWKVTLRHGCSMYYKDIRKAISIGEIYDPDTIKVKFVEEKRTIPVIVQKK